jgi:hypothetical protein
MSGIFSLAFGAFAMGIFLSRFNALAILMASFLVFGGTVILHLMQHSLLTRSVLLGIAAVLALQAGYFAGQVIRPRE